MSVSPKRSTWILVAALVLTALVRVPSLTRQGLWVDEIFSLAMATGHSLEHPAALADPSAGDFVQGAGTRSSEEWRAYARHDEPAAGAGRVLRAVRLSDTNPPLYYLALWAWTRCFGTGDAALRGLSLLCALACVPFLARLARRMGGHRAVVPVLVLFALTPLSIYYATEGRMYALLWLELVVLAELTLALRARGGGARRLSAWSLVAAAGFLTHYFFAFAWLALVACLAWRPRRLERGKLALALGATGLLVLPWYAHLGESLRGWRVTMDWLEVRPDGFERPAAALELLLGFFSGSAELLWGEHRGARALALALFGLLFAAFGRRLGPRLCGGARRFAWFWLAAACAGPLVFDALRGTYTSAVPRYALAGLPAALVLAAAALAGLAPRTRGLLLAGIVLAFVPHLCMLHARATRSWNPLRETARTLANHAGAEDLVLVHSIPSGVIGIARYHTGSAPIAAWVEQLGERGVPDSVSGLVRGRRRILLVRIHECGAPALVEDWLRENGRLVGELSGGAGRALCFELEESGVSVGS